VREEEALQMWVTAPLCLHHEECWACNRVGGQGFIATHVCRPRFAEEAIGLVRLHEDYETDDTLVED
jgi:hypothetical protein